jgi:RimJ/RimL family protein N-acetyltransferase
MSFSLETERLTLRLRDPDDAVEYLELLAEHPGRAVPSLADARRHLTAQREEAERTGIGFLAIRRRADDEQVGYCGLLVGRATFDEPELGYELLRRYQGSGYATEAAAAVVDAAFATGRQRLWASVAAWNDPSFRVLTKLGFRRDRVVSNHQGELVLMVRDA